MMGPLTLSPLVDGDIMKMASKAFGSAPTAERQKNEVQRANQFSPPAPLFHSGRDLQAKL